MGKLSHGRIRGGLLAVVGTGALLVATLATAGAASAGTSAASAGGQRVVVITSPMKIVGFDPAVAAAHGFTIRESRTGQQFAVSGNGQAVPDGSVSGNCGSSYVYMTARTAKGHLGYGISTGFHVAGSAVDYKWTVDVYGPQGHQFSWGGGLFFGNSWAGSGSQNVSKAGTYEAIVTSPAYAVLDDGAVCSSAHPTAKETV